MSDKSQPRPAGIWMLCLWAVGLAVETVARALLLSIQQTADQTWEFSLVLPTTAITTTYVLALGAAAVGLLLRRNWGRRLFLGLITAYYGLLFAGSIALWGPLIGRPLNAPGQGWVTTVVLEASIGLGFGWWYLNRWQVKRWFGIESQPRENAHQGKGAR